MFGLFDGGSGVLCNVWRDCERGNFSIVFLFGLFSSHQGTKSLYHFDAAIMQNSELVIRTGADSKFIELFLGEKPLSSIAT